VVTLLTDFGLEDEYVGLVKGVILRVNPSAQIVDLCHEVPPGDVSKANWLLRWSWGYSPGGTVHVVVVDPGVGSSRKILCLDHQGHRFLAPDNGVLSSVLAGISRPRLYAVANRRYALKTISHTFHGRDLFAPAAGHLSRGLAPYRLGPRVTTFRRLALPAVKKNAHALEGRVIHLDRFGNAVTNLPAEEVKRLARRGPLRVLVKGIRPLKIQSSYSSVSQGDPLALVGSRDLLEIAVSRGSAHRKLRLQVGDPILLVVQGSPPLVPSDETT